jgi:CheY-like chemotaxis protein
VLGYVVIEAENGVVAVDMFHKNHKRVDVVLLDMEMPGMRGIDCLRELRTQSENIAAVLCSGYARDVTAEELRSEGFHGQLCKPYRLAELERVLEQAIQSAGKQP